MSNTGTVPVASKPFIFCKKSIIAGRVESNAAKTSACRNKLITEAVEKMFEDIECKHKTLFSPHKNMMNFCELLQTLQC